MRRHVRGLLERASAALEHRAAPVRDRATARSLGVARRRGAAAVIGYSTPTARRPGRARATFNDVGASIVDATALRRELLAGLRGATLAFFGAGRRPDSHAHLLRAAGPIELAAGRLGRRARGGNAGAGVGVDGQILGREPGPPAGRGAQAERHDEHDGARDRGAGSDGKRRATGNRGRTTNGAHGAIGPWRPRPSKFRCEDPGAPDHLLPSRRARMRKPFKYRRRRGSP